MKLIWRNLLKYKSITFINIFGLSVGFAICTLIFLFLKFEFDFDSFHSKQKDIYRLNTTLKYENSPESHSARAAVPVGPFLKQECSDIDNYLRVILGNEDFLFKANGKESAVSRSIFADSTFFDFFDFELIYGDPNLSLIHI